MDIDTQVYLNSIQTIRDKCNNDDVLPTTYTIDHIASKFSNTKQPIYKLVINGKEISRNNTYIVCYTCITCNIQQEVSLNLFMRKVNRGGVNCTSCVNKNEEKCNAQSTFMKSNAKQIIKGEYSKPRKVSSLSLSEHMTMSRNSWEDEDDDFRDSYFNAHLTFDEFERIKGQIKGINNKKITSLVSWVYEPIYKIHNQTKYTPMLVNVGENVVEKPYYITFDCESCGCEYTHRDLETVKNKIKMLCRDCTLTNKTFRVRKLNLKSGKSIVWQSTPEKRFILWCEDNNITIQNGPKLPYTFRDALRDYRVDFELPELKMLIEIKDNHCWHKSQVESGKHGAKVKAAEDWCKLNGYNYTIVFPTNLATTKATIIAKSCKI
jgi:hypothetical protein